MPFKTKEQKDEYNRNYYANKTKPSKLKREPVNVKSDECIQCKKFFVKGYLEKHLKTKAHAKRIAELIQQNN